MYTVVKVCVLVLLHYVQSQELIANGDFEGSFTGNWFCSSCTLQASTDAFSGTFSGQVTARGQFWAGVRQEVQLVPGNKYFFTSYVKILNEFSPHISHVMDGLVDIERTDGQHEYVWFARLPYMRVVDGWQLLAGDFEISAALSIAKATVYFQINEKEVNYLVDQVSLTQIIPEPNWREDANARIESIRKSNILIRANIQGGTTPSDIQIRATQTTHGFPFGTCVAASRITASDTVNQRYQQFFYDNFNYAVLENALKWKQMEPTQGQINWQLPENAVNALIANNVPVRGHCLAWGVQNNVPDWLQTMPGAQIRTEIDRRIDAVVARFSGKLQHWDVNNEQLHGYFFENRTGDPEITQYMHFRARSVDTNVRLFINDYSIVSDVAYATALLAQAKTYAANGVPLNGIGIQSHLSGPVDIDKISKRLEIVAQSSIPIWITELDYENTDVNARADGYEDAIRFYFSDPAIEGILLWGFWDGAHWKPNAALVNGNNFVVNAAGLRFQQLLQQEWRTNAAFTMSTPTEEFGFRGFHGNYQVEVLNRGTVVQTRQFSVTKDQDTVIWDITV